MNTKFLSEMQNGRPGQRLEENIATYFKEIRLGEGRVQWRALVNTVMKL
jgi:hypothetical protein